jgi:hypothetical protein
MATKPIVPPTLIHPSPLFFHIRLLVTVLLLAFLPELLSAALSIPAVKGYPALLTTFVFCLVAHQFF